MRKNNIVLYNISESTKQNAKEREEDLAKTKELISQGIKVEGCRIEKIIRLGRTTEGVRSRPFLVKMEEQGDKWNVLKNAKNLKNAEGWQKKVGVSADLSFEERVKERELVKQLKLKRENGDKGWYIYRGALCRRDF